MTGRTGHLQFEDEDHLVLVLVSVMQVDQLVMVQVIHDVDLLADERLLHRVRDRDELGRVDVPGLDLPAAMHNAKGTGADLLEDLVVVIHAVLRLDVHRLGDVLRVDVEHELIVVLDLDLLAADLLARVRID